MEEKVEEKGKEVQVQEEREIKSSRAGGQKEVQMVGRRRCFRQHYVEELQVQHQEGLQ